MPSTKKRKQYDQMMNFVSKFSPANWEDISNVLSGLKNSVPLPSPNSKNDFLKKMAKGTAFLTFDYGIDGVSIEISKYAQALEDLYRAQDDGTIHFIGGDFYPQADSVIKPDWIRFRIEGINGWSKWDDGKWFASLFYQDMPEGSETSHKVAVDIYRQAVSIAQRLGDYLVSNNIDLFITVNIASNPGNIALTIALVLVTEAMGIYVINSNHDYYWEGGKPTTERKPGESPGVRDHFFHNIDNRPFYKLFKTLYPWNGRRWLQVNINALQSQRLVEGLEFPENKVFELSTAVSNEFFKDYSQEDVKYSRLRMGYILSDGNSIIHPIPVETHLANLSKWMRDQRPLALAARAGLTVDPTSNDLIYLLQPTRVIARKRIEREFHLINALLQHKPFRDAFEYNEMLQLVMHITGPTPIEHQTDLETVLQAFIDVIQSVPVPISDRLFVAFSVGNEDHPTFQSNNFERLYIEDIYRMATAVVFPSETEGRGLPIIEASASGIPLICSRYHPQEVFAGVVGEHLPENLQIRYTLFPEGDFTTSFLNEVTKLLLRPEEARERLQHNREAVRLRYSTSALRSTFENLLDELRLTSQ
jgi:glycosyltransferase involved in cell wall biosynthesis